MRALGITTAQLFLDPGVLAKTWIKQNTKVDQLLNEELETLQKQYEQLAEKVKKIDLTLEPHVQALLSKHRKNISRLSEKLIRAERRKQTAVIDKINYIKDTLFPKGGLQERSDNFSELYLIHGKALIDLLIEHFRLPSDELVIFGPQV